MLDSTGVAQYPWAHGEVLTAQALNAAIAQSTGASTGTAPPDSPGIGTLWFNPVTGQLSVWNGAEWQAVGGIVDAPSDSTVYGRMNAAWTQVLPLAGGTVTGALVVTATGAPTPRSVQDRFGEVVNVRDFGATGNGTTDDTVAITAAVAAIPATGSALYFPTGIYLMSGTVLLTSGTTVCGDGPSSELLAAATYAIPSGRYAIFFENVHNTSGGGDHDIVVRDLTLNAGTWGYGGQYHAVMFTAVNRVNILNVVFQCGGCGDATALLKCVDTIVDGCAAYGFTNCSYDHWWSPQYNRVTNCYAQSASSVQMVNFNPEDITGSSTGQAAVGFVLANCNFVFTGSVAPAVMLEPLGTGSTVSNVIVRGNTFNNVLLTIRGATTNVVVSGNIFTNVLGGGEVIASYVNNGGTPADISIIGNVVNGAATAAASIAALRIWATSATIIGNMISGSTGTGASIDTSTFAPVVFGNTADKAIQIANAVANHGGAAFPTLTVTGQASVGGELVFTQNTSGTPPASLAGGGGALTWNYGGGTAEVDFWNLYNGPGTSFSFYQKTGASTVALLASLSTIAGLVTQVPIQTATYNVGLTSPATITSGTAAPVSTQPAGSLYLRSGGASGARLYVSAGAGTWTAVAGV